jgi:hypothetical protein
LLLQHKNPQQNQKISDLNKNSQKKIALHASFFLSLSPKQLMTTEHRSIQRRNNLTYNKTAETRRNLHKNKKNKRNDNNKTPVEDAAGSNKSSISVQKNSKNEKKSPQKNRTKNDNNCEEQRSKTTPQQD